MSRQSTETLERRVAQVLTWLPPAPADGWYTVGDPAQAIHILLAEARRHAGSRKYVAAAEALAEAERRYWANEPAIRGARYLAKVRVRQAQTTAWSKEGSAAWQKARAPERKAIVSKGLELRKLPQFSGPRRLSAIAKEIKRKIRTTLDIRQIRRILGAAGV